MATVAAVVRWWRATVVVLVLQLVRGCACTAVGVCSVPVAAVVGCTGCGAVVVWAADDGGGGGGDGGRWLRPWRCWQGAGVGGTGAAGTGAVGAAVGAVAAVPASAAAGCGDGGGGGADDGGAGGAVGGVDGGGGAGVALLLVLGPRLRVDQHRSAGALQCPAGSATAVTLPVASSDALPALAAAPPSLLSSLRLPRRRQQQRDA